LAEKHMDQSGSIHRAKCPPARVNGQRACASSAIAVRESVLNGQRPSFTCSCS
jgi:hypothetical protein